MRSDFVKSMDWRKDSLELLDQRKIPKSKEYIQCKSLEEVIHAIKEMIVRGAPAIALSGLFGIVLYLKSLSKKPEYSELKAKLDELLASRPTAVNLRLALQSFQTIISSENFSKLSLNDLILDAENFALNEFSKDLETNISIARNGMEIFKNKNAPLEFITHCNTGAIATAGVGTAIGVFRALKSENIPFHVYVDETRPYLQGSRLTAWELMEENISCTILADNMAGWLMNEKNIDAVIVGADRIASNGDTANKIGTYSLAILAKEHNVPFYVAASATSFDFKIKSGKEIKIEMRDETELTQYSFLKNSQGKNLIEEGIFSPIGARAINPSFDITPAKYITGIITERGVISPVSENLIQSMMSKTF
ncbi:MAG: S-methyl-5-thioribose-1-phosphate isomerase [Leptospiraceae bacterium]|nr:S-methyl-5-thioribose-1-phosphate isomerase [Leptospiraceae bacterium]